MLEILETSFQGKVTVVARNNIFELKSTRSTYREGDIAKVSAVSEDVYRSAGKAAAGLVIGGVLTGGIGLVVGAAFGGRRRQEGIFIIITRDGNNVVFKTDDKNTITKLHIMAAKLELNSGSLSRSIEPNMKLHNGWQPPKEEKARGDTPMDQQGDSNKITVEVATDSIDPVLQALLAQAMKK